MHILYVCPYYKPAYVYGGPVQCIADLCEELVRMGAKVTVFTTNANRGTKLDVPLKKPVNVDGVIVMYFPLSLHGLSYFYSGSLADAVNTMTSEFDLVIIDSVWGHALIPTATACARFHVPYVISTHGQLFPWALANKRLKKSIYLELIGKRYINRAAAIRCTDLLEAEAVAKLGFRPPIFVVPHSVCISSFTNLKSLGYLRSQFHIPDYADVMIFLGRITQYKRPDIAVDTLGAAQSFGREMHLVIVGPDEDGIVQQLQNQAQSLGCNDKLHFTGLLGRERVICALLDADLLLMPSEIQENFNMSALEALAAGIPILVSEGIPVGRWAEMAGAGRVVPCAKDEFQQAALDLLSKPEELKIMGKRGRDLVQRCFDVSVVSQQMLAHYQSIIATGQPVPSPDLGLKPS